MKHPHSGKNYSEEDKARCPHLSGRTTVADSPFKEKIRIQADSEPNSAIKASRETPSSEGQGGCPMMNIDDNKRNPGLFIPDISYPVPYISPFHEYLHLAEDGTAEDLKKYPSSLLDSLCLTGKDYDKYRKLEVGYKFFACDDLKEQGNKKYRDGNYTQAMLDYIKACSILRWLEIDETKEQHFFDQLKEIEKHRNEPSEVRETKQTAATNDSDEENENENVPEEIEDPEKTKVPDIANFFKDKMMRLVFTKLTDENVQLKDGYDLRNASDKEMQDNIVFSLYLNMIACNIYLQNHEENRKLITECEAINGSSSLFLFRKAQALYANAEATTEDLMVARAAIQRGIRNKKTEKIFEHNPRFLHMFGLENHETLYELLSTSINARLTQVTRSVTDRMRVVLKRINEIQNAEKDIIARGMVPKDGPERGLCILNKDLNIESKTLVRLLALHKKALCFYQNHENPDKLAYAKKVYLNVRKTHHEFSSFWNLDILSEDSDFISEILRLCSEFSIDLTSEKTRARIKRVQREMARESMEKGEFDYDALSHVVKELVEEQRKEEEEKTKNSPERTGEERIASSGKGGVNWMFMSAIGLMLIVFAARYWLKLF